MSTTTVAPFFRRARVPELFLALCTILFGAFQLFVSFHKLNNLQATMMDLGDFRQEMFQISHGNWWAFDTVFQTPAVAQDGFFLMYPLAYAYRFLGGVGVLFFVQAAGTAAAAWGIFRAARLHGLSQWSATAVGAAFLLYPGIIGGSQYDFHPDFIALPLLVWAYVSYTAGHRRSYYWLLLFAALSKNIALVSIAGWGLGLLVYKRQWRDGLLAIAASAAFFLLEVDVLIPRFFDGGVNGVNLSLYSYLGHGFIGVIIGIVTHLPLVLHQVLGEGTYILWLCAPVLGLAVLGSAAVPAMLSLFLLNALSSFRATQSIVTQYQVMLAGWAFLALVEALARFRNKWPLLVGVIASTVLFESMYLGAVLFPSLAVTNPALPAVQAAVRRLPAHAVVWTQNRLGVWVSSHRFIGIDREQVPHLYVAPLPLLWREAGPVDGSQTVILGIQPVSPFFADVVERALQAGYRISFHQGHVFALLGTRHFDVPTPNLDAIAWQPAGSSWVIPAWTQASVATRIAWKQGWVTVPQGHRGLTFPGIEMLLEPGHYIFSVQIRDAIRSTATVLGSLSAGGHAVAIRGGSSSTTLRLRLNRRKLVYLSLNSTGHAVFNVLQFHVQRVEPGLDSVSAP